MNYTLSFSKKVDGVRQPYVDDNGEEITLTVKADSRSGAINSPESTSFCQGNQVSVRRVTP